MGPDGEHGDDEEEDQRSERQKLRGHQRDVGDRSARLARALMLASDSLVKRMTVDDDVRDAITRARAVHSPIARRRAERTLAGDLRGADLVEIERQLAKVDDSRAGDAREFKLAEQWRAKLIDQGMRAAETFPGGATPELTRLVEAAQRARDTGRPPGAAKALFRHVSEKLKSEKKR